MSAEMVMMGMCALVLVVISYVFVAAAKLFFANERAIKEEIERVEADLKWLDSTGGIITEGTPYPPKQERPS